MSETTEPQGTILVIDDEPQLRRALENAPQNLWAGFQIFYRMSESEVRSATGLDLVESMLAVYREVLPTMNLCMQIELADQYLNRTSDPR